jgi:hypothetical protein
MNSGEINALTPAPTESKGSLVGSIIVILILVIGAIYLFSRPAAAPINPTPAETATSTQETVPAGSASSTLEVVASSTISL